MLRILMISPIPLQPMNVGDRVRISHLAQGLARHTQMTLVTPVEESLTPCQGRPEGLANLRLVHVPGQQPSRRQQLQSFASTWPYHVRLRYSRAIEHTVQQLLKSESYDLVYCHFLTTLPYAVDRGLPVIWDQHNVDRIYWQHKVDLHRQKPWRKALMKWNLAKVIRMESKMLTKVAGVVAVSPADQIFMRTLLPNSTPCWVAPNGVATEYFQLSTCQSTAATDKQPLILGFFGSLDLELNQMAAVTLLQTIFPKVMQQLPDQQLSLILLGRNPPQWLHDLVACTPHPRVTLTGTVDDVRPYLQQMDILVLPLESGAGTKLRVVEAMAAGVCVVGSEFALSGLTGVQAGEHCHLAQHLDEFVLSICSLARNPDARYQMARVARQLIEERYRWQQIAERLAIQLQGAFGQSQKRERERVAVTCSRSCF
ncbi:MAG: glycosyltransferase [Caldilineaceae bacterium]